MSIAKRAAQTGKKALIIDDFMRGGSSIKGICELLAEVDTEVAGIGVAIVSKEPEEKKIPVFAAALGKTPDEPEYDFPIEAEADVCIYVLARNSGEGSDRQIKKGDYLLTDDEVRDIHRCNEKYAKFMLVLNVGGPVDLSPVVNSVENILLLGQLGTVTGDVLADIVLGKCNPSGKPGTE